jgi:site-specific DNA-methyltransferase (adenine-specific)
MNDIQLIMGDCLEAMKDIPDGSVDCVVTDPPYGMSFQSNYRKEKHRKIENDDSLEWLDTFFDQCYRKMKEDTHIYSFCSFHHIDKFKVSMQRFFDVKNILIWQKNNTGMGDLEGDYAPKYEMILFGAKGRRTLNGSRDPNIVPCYKTGNKLHPTQKPEELMVYLIEKSSTAGDTILDPFMGSGTTGVACVQTGRKFIGIEKDKKYFEIAKKRIEGAQLPLF